MNFSVYYEAIIKNASIILFVLYILSLSYESQQEKSEGFPILFISAPFKSINRVAILCYRGMIDFLGNYETVFKKILELILSLYHAILETLSSFKTIFWNIMEVIETIIKFPIDLILNFHNSVEKLLQYISKLFLFLYQILLAILSPIGRLAKEVFFYLLNLLRFPLNTIQQFAAFLYNFTKAIAKGVAKTLKTVASSLFDFIKNKLLKFSLTKILKMLLSPFRYLLSLLQKLHLRIKLIPFLKKMLQLLLNIPHILYVAICDSIQFLYELICYITRSTVQALIAMFYDIIDLLNITKYLPEFLKPLFEMLYRIIKFIADMIMQIALIPYRLAVYLIKLLKHPIQTIIDTINYLIALLRNVVSAIVQLLESSIIQFILGIMKTPLNLLKRLLSKISFRNFLRIFSFPFNALKYIGRALSTIAKAIYDSIADVARSIANGLIHLLTLLSNVSIRKLLYYLMSPIRFLWRIIKDLLSIPFLRIFVTIFEFIVYRLVFLINIPLKLLYIFFESFIIFFSKDLSLKNVFDMWDNVCWPRDTEYCKQILAKAQNNGNFNDYNNYNNYDNYNNYNNYNNDDYNYAGYRYA